MRRILTLTVLMAMGLAVLAQQPFGKGRLTVTKLAPNAVRIQYDEGHLSSELPDWLYVQHDPVKRCPLKIHVDKRRQLLTISDPKGRPVFTATSHQLSDGVASLVFQSPKDESLFGLG